MHLSQSRYPPFDVGGAGGGIPRSQSGDHTPSVSKWRFGNQVVVVVSVCVRVCVIAVALAQPNDGA